MPLEWNLQHEKVKKAFLDQKAELVTLPKGMKLWKLTAYKPKNLNISRFTGDKISPWWSNYSPFKDDKNGVKAVFGEAVKANQTFLTYVRVRSAVTMEWNKLTYYMETSLVNPKEAFWGKYAPQPVSDNSQSLSKDLRYEEPVFEGYYYPEILGGWPNAFQLYIPELKTKDLRPPEYFSSTDHKALTAQFNTLY